mgnify:CR=1 FL=1
MGEERCMRACVSQPSWRDRGSNGARWFTACQSDRSDARFVGNRASPSFLRLEESTHPTSFLVGDVYEDTEDDLRTLYIDGNGCVSCHRFSDPRSFSFFGAGPTYEVNEHMPPSDPGSMAADFQALLDCADAGPEDTPECEWRQVPGAPEAE